MSEENVEEFVRKVCGAISVFDADAVVALCDPDVDFQSRITAVDEETYRGLAGVRRWLARLEEAFEWMDVAATEVISDGKNRVVGVMRFQARGRESGAEVEQRFFQAAKLRNGRALWWRFFDSKEQALEAAGLS